VKVKKMIVGGFMAGGITGLLLVGSLIIEGSWPFFGMLGTFILGVFATLVWLMRMLRNPSEAVMVQALSGVDVQKALSELFTPGMEVKNDDKKQVKRTKH